MIKNIFVFFTILCCALWIAPMTYACDPLGCLFVGHEQDTLILGEITSVQDDISDVKIIFIFPQNKIKSLRKYHQVLVKNINNIIAPTGTISTVVGKKYLMSLNQEDNFYVPVWGIYEITGTSYADAKLVINQSLDDKALEIFIKSGGRQTDFSFDYSGIEPVLTIYIQKQSNESNSKIFWYIAGVGILVLISLIVLFRRKKSN